MKGYSYDDDLRKAPAGYPQSRAAQRRLYGARGIDASAPMANPKRNIGAVDDDPLEGQGLTSKGDWAKMFTPIGQPPNATPTADGGDQFGGADTIARMPATGASLPVLAAGGNKHTDQWMQPDTSIRPLPAHPSDSLYTPGPFMPQPRSRGFNPPAPLTGMTGDAASDRANLGANMSMASPGGANFWSKPAPSGWQSGTADVSRIFDKYGDKRKRASFSWDI